MTELEKRAEEIPFHSHHILFLLPEKPQMFQAKQEGGLPEFSLDSLANNISTDAIFPSQYAFQSRENWGECALTGFPGIEEKTLQEDKINIIVAGQNFGCGSAREHAPIALLLAGVELIIAKSFDPVFQRNCSNLGILTSTDIGLASQLQAGSPIPKEEIITQLPSLQAEIVKHGGLIPYVLYQQEKAKPTPKETQPRPLTMMEKIIGANLEKTYNLPTYPKAGDKVVLKPDVLTSYDLFTLWIFQLLESYGLTAQEAEKLVLFSDHAIQAPFPGAEQILKKHSSLAKEHGAKLYPFIFSSQGESISSGVGHTLLRELELSPGNVLLMTDSHTPTAGALLSLGLPTSITGITAALATGEYIFQIPKTVRINLEGNLPQGVTAKDVILYLLSLNPVKEEDIFRGKCLEFGGPGLNSWWPDEIGVLTNMSKEGGALTALAEPTEKTIEYLAKLIGREVGETKRAVEKLKPDPEAKYSQILSVDLSQISPMVALPGHPGNGVPLKELKERPDVQTVYIGSCTGGTWLDIVQAAEVLKGKRIAKRVRLYIQPSSITIYQAMKEARLDEVFKQAGAIILPPACGACAGLGIGGPKKGEIGISTSNRNWPGRMGKGKVYLTSSLVAAASAIKGSLCHPSELN